MGPILRALGSQEDFKQRRDRVSFGFRSIPLAAMWWVDQGGETGWEPRGSWVRKSHTERGCGEGRRGLAGRTIRTLSGTGANRLNERERFRARPRALA